MLPPKCFTCGKFLADIEVMWVQYLNDIRADKNNTEEKISNLRAEKLNHLCIKKRCCRSLVLTYVDLIEIII